MPTTTTHTKFQIFLLFLQTSSRTTIRTPYQPILIALQTPLQAPFVLIKHLPTPSAIFAGHKPGIPTMLTHEAGSQMGEPFQNDLRQFSTLEQVLDHLSATHVLPSHEHLRQRHMALAQRALQLLPVSYVHRHVPLVHPNPKPLQNHAHRVAVLERSPNPAQAR